jgi:hypothetical protein
VSNAIRYDSLLVRELARELDRALAGARLVDVILDRQRLRCTLVTAAPRRDQAPPPSLLWQLHPGAGHVTAAPADGVQKRSRPGAAQPSAAGARVPLRPR